MKEAVHLRPLCDQDFAAVAQIFHDAVQNGTGDAYSKPQRDAWSGSAPDLEGWRRKISGMTGVVAETGDTPVGFMTLDAEGYIDLAFVAPTAARSGVGGQLYRAILGMARSAGVERLTTHASKVAKGFFEQHGWSVVRQQTVVRRGVPLTNFLMELRLG